MIRSKGALRATLSALALGGLLGVSACATGDVKNAASASVGTVGASTTNSPAVRAVALPRGKSTATERSEMLKAGDIDAVVRSARLAADATGKDKDAGFAAFLVVMDDLAAGNPAEARRRFRALSNGLAGDLVEPWLLLAEGDADGAVRRAQRASSLSPALSGTQAALIREASGDANAARALYGRLERQLDTTPPKDGDPSSLEEALRALQAPQTMQILYRSALLAHRSGDTGEATRLYGLVAQYAGDSPDLKANQARLAAGQPPLEAAVDYVRGLGRWSLFLSDEFSRQDGIAKAISDPTPTKDLISPSGAMFGQLGIAYDPSADDWTLSVAQQLLAADALDGAERIVRRIPSRSLFAAEASLIQGQIALRRDQDPAAARFAEAALRASPNRHGIAMAAGALLAQAGREREALSAYDAALRSADKAEDKATALVARGYINLYFGRMEAAVADARAALAADRRNDDVRIAAVAIFKDWEPAFAEGVGLGRELLREDPDSVSRLNQLGYTLIHRDETLEEGLLLLHRGASLGPNDYAVIDSLGWAYYLYGDFDEALRLIRRADELSSNDPNSEILDHLGDVYWRLNKPDEARAAWKRALAARPEAARRAQLDAKMKDGLTTPAPTKRPMPVLEEVKPRERQET